MYNLELIIFNFFNDPDKYRGKKAFYNLKGFSEFYYKNYTRNDQRHNDCYSNCANKPIDRRIWVNRKEYGKYPIQKKTHANHYRETYEKDSSAQCSQLGEI